MTIDAASSIRVQTIDHITIVVKNLETSCHFYENVLGMERKQRPDFGFPGAWFQAGKTQIHMNVESDAAGTAGLPDMGAGHPPTGFHFAFEVDDCDAAAAELTRIGIEIIAGPRSRPDGPRQLYIYDPDHHLVELYSQ